MKKKAVVLLALALLICIGAGAAYFYKVNTVQKKFVSIAVRDNALLSEILTIDKDSPRITFAEYLSKLEKNREERDKIISEVATIEPLIYKDQLSLYNQLLQLENEFVRAEEAKVRYLLRYSIQKEALQEAEEEGKKAVVRAKSGEASSFSQSSIERGMAERNESQVGPAAEQVIVFEYTEKYEKALSKTAKELSEAIIESQNALEIMFNNEQPKYPTFLPDRHLKAKFDTKRTSNLALQSVVEADRSKYGLDDPYWDK